MYIFNWENVPGNDNGKLVEYLEQRYGVDWVRKAKIEKFDNSEIIMSTEKNLLSLKLSTRNDRIILTINKVKTDEFAVKTEDKKLNVYEDVEQKKRDIRTGAKIETNYPYSVLGALALAGLIVVFVMGYYGTQSAGIFSPREAFFVIGASILILTAACAYLLFTLRNTVSILKIHEEELQAARATAQERRIESLENRNTGVATKSLGPRVAALEPQLASLETRVTTLENVNTSVYKIV
jgi:hypothetical protein